MTTPLVAVTAARGVFSARLYCFSFVYISVNTKNIERKQHENKQTNKGNDNQ